MSDFYSRNRKRLAGALKDGSLAVFFAGSPRVKRGDEFYPFAPSRNFLYLTGLDAPELVFLTRKQDGKTKETLFVQRFDDYAAKWTGAPLSKEDAAGVSGIDDVRFLDEFESFVGGLLFKSKPIVYLDLEQRALVGETTAELAFAAKIRQNFPALDIRDVYPIMAKTRLIKSKEEVKNIKEAIGITHAGILAMMENAAPDMFEYEIEAYFDFELKSRGVRQTAFQSIAAGGKNAAVLHYTDNNCRVADGELILFDVGAQKNWYSADITRTFPVNGVFSARQKQIYNVVLECQLKVIDKVKPGIAFAELNETAKGFYEKELKKIGLIASKKEVENFYWHGVSHMLGLETHDAGRGDEGVLQAGMVLTVEPGLYIADENLGIRIEDDVLVTEKGHEVLSADIIKTVDEIEGFMAK